MKITKAILIQYITEIHPGWSKMAVQGFSTAVEQGLPYYTDDRHCIFVISKGDKKLPVDELSRSNESRSNKLKVFTGYDVVNLKLITTLISLEYLRTVVNNRSNMDIIVAGEQSKDSFTSERTFYGVSFCSTSHLINSIHDTLMNEDADHLLKIKRKYGFPDKHGSASRLVNACIQSSLKKMARQGID